MSKFVDSGDLDLGAVEFHLADGTRLTEARAADLGEQIAERAFDRGGKTKLNRPVV